MMLPVAFPASAGVLTSGTTPGRSIDLRVGIRSTYDSNSSRSNKNSATSRNLKQGDIRTTPNITANITQPFGRNTFSLSGLLGYDFYMHNTRLNRERINLDASAGFKFTRCNADLSGQYQRNQSDLGYYGNATGGAATARVKNAETIRGIDVSGGCGATIGFQPNVGFAYQRASNSNPLLQVNDRDTKTYTGGIAYVNPTLGTAQVFVSRAETRYDNRFVPGSTRHDGHNVMSYGVSVQRDIGAALSASAQVSYTKVHSLSPVRADSSGLNWAVNAGLRASPRLQLNAKFDRKIGTSLTVTSRYNVNTDYSLGANYALTSRIQLTGSYTLQHRKFYGFQSVTGPTIGGDTVDQQTVGLNFARNQAMTFRLRGGRDHRHTGNAGFYDYTNYLAEIGVDLRF